MTAQAKVAPASAQPAGQRGQVLAFLADAKSEQIVKEWISDALIPFSSVRRGGIGAAIDHLSTERSPNMLVVDISGIDLPTSHINRLAEVCEPGVNVVAVGDRNDVGLYRDLLQSGVTDYLVKPLTRELIQKALSDVTEGVRASRISQKVGKLVTFIGARGGVGTTTLAANLAWYLANKRGRRVGLVDLDLQNGDCGLMLNVKPSPGLREALVSPNRIDNLFVDRAMTRSGERLFVLNSEEPLDEELRFEPDAADKLLALLQAQFHYVVADMPRAVGGVHLRLLELAQVRVIVADLSLGAIRDTIRLQKLLASEDPRQRTMVVVNRKGEYGRKELPIEEFAKAAGITPSIVIPFDAKAAAAAANYGTLVAEDGNRIAEGIVAIANGVSGQRPQARKRFGRLFK
jgi:pilus assembly protein CpaE